MARLFPRVVAVFCLAACQSAERTGPTPPADPRATLQGHALAIDLDVVAGTARARAARTRNRQRIWRKLRPSGSKMRSLPPSQISPVPG